MEETSGVVEGSRLHTTHGGSGRAGADAGPLAGPFVSFVAADDRFGGAIEPGQAVQAVPGQDPVHGRGG